EGPMGVLIPILALCIPVLAIALNGMQKVYRLRIEEARIRAGAFGEGGAAELEQLRSEVDDLRRELGEVHERLDFTERLLSRNADRDRLTGGQGPEGA
ncbi:MAG: hypothetical protein SF070_09645, partial [Gemmatimonadota bacterium]|nr:hypothetical protein [Gemmatimonadota bacterium]